VKMLNSTEDAHLKRMSTLETDEHLQGKCLPASLPIYVVALPLIGYGGYVCE